MSSRRDTEAIDVTWQDQRRICTFGRMHKRYTLLCTELKHKKDDLDKLSDATDECYIADEIKMVFGESFVNVDCDTATSLLASRTELVRREVDELEAEKQALDSAMEKVKAELYAKFGSQIYLENE